SAVGRLSQFARSRSTIPASDQCGPAIPSGGSESFAPSLAVAIRGNRAPVRRPGWLPCEGRSADSWLARQTREHGIPRLGGAGIRVGGLDAPLQFSQMPIRRNERLVIGNTVPDQVNEFESLPRIETVDAELFQGQIHEIVSTE